MVNPLFLRVELAILLLLGAGASFRYSLVVQAAQVIDFEVDVHGVPDDDSYETSLINGAKFNETLRKLRRGDTLLFPNKTFHMMGGIIGLDLTNVTLVFDGILVFTKHITRWPRKGPGKNAEVLDCMHFNNVRDVTFTSSHGPNGGQILGNGELWWGFPGIGYLARGENRPKLMVVSNSENVLFENISLRNSPYWSFWAPNAYGLEVRDCKIDVRRDGKDEHTLNDLAAFNTDGFDVSGRNVWIHDVIIWNQDDCISVKGNSEHMLFERITASGFGLTIGSINHNEVVNNITFRDSFMSKTVKGIYIKYGENVGSKATISNVLYENITMQEPDRAIWIGPAQQSDSLDPCAAHPCSICWSPGSNFECNAPAALYKNITLRDITIYNPKNSIGVILGNSSLPMRDVTFENVVISKGPGFPQERTDYKYYCPTTGVMSGIAIGKTDPVPTCFQDFTIATTGKIV